MKIIILKIEIEKVEDGLYRIYISRYAYSEVFEGKLVPGLGEDRLDWMITKNSKLVSCKLLRTDILPEGDNYYLKGAEIETLGPKEYENALKSFIVQA